VIHYIYCSIYPKEKKCDRIFPTTSWQGLGGTDRRAYEEEDTCMGALRCAGLDPTSLKVLCQCVPCVCSEIIFVTYSLNFSFG
jgi:hypothetical protein